MTTTCARIPGSGDTPDLERMGGKGAALARLVRAGLPVPAFVVLPPAACHDSLAAQERSWPALPDAELTLDETWRDALREALADRCGGAEVARRARWAVRSSGLDEDGAGHAFAGQFDSVLDVAWDELERAVPQVWRSGAGARVRAYRREHGLDEAGQPPAVIVQRMVDADAAGVAFGADPVSGRRGVRVVSAVPGLGEALVSGERDADTWWIDRRGTVLDRQRAADADPSGPGSPGGAAIDDETAVAVARLAERCGILFERAQDIEWASADGAIHLLQSRAITSLVGVPDSGAPAVLWDNSNIAESYSGVTSAMTFSFARRVYEAVYREFCRLMKVAPRAIEANDQVFAHMLGRVRGRVYYHLHHWYRVLALLPGFQANRTFMEQMMGVREGLPATIAAQLSEATWGERAADRVRLAYSAAALAWQHFTLPRAIARFRKRLDTALAEPDPPLHACRPDELAASYRSLESALLRRWDAPLVNDFLAMIFFGVLGKLTVRWCGDSAESLQNDLLVGEGGIISAEPAHLVMEMARRIQGDPDLVERFLDEDAPALLRSLREDAAQRDLATAIEAYLDRFGDRCLEELKLESPTLADDPTPLFRSVGGAARAMHGRPAGSSAAAGAAQAVRRAAEARATAAMAGHPVRRMIFRWVLRHARGRVRDRENLRFERTRLFGRVRRLILEMGRRLAADGALRDPRDVFHLELHELLGAIDGDAACDDLRGLAAVRAADDERHRAAPPPPERIVTHGPPAFLKTLSPDLTGTAPVAAEGDDDVLRGLGCCPGVVRGRARVIHDPRGARLEPGDILVAERTDPGWILLFPAAAGVLVERGSLLSHSAIVARELGLPAVVSIPRLMVTLEDGETIEIDGSAGTVRRLAPGTDPGTDQGTDSETGP